MLNLKNFFSDKQIRSLGKREEIAELLHISPEKLDDLHHAAEVLNVATTKEESLRAKDMIAQVLKSSKTAMDAFEASYKAQGEGVTDDSFFSADWRTEGLKEGNAADVDGLIDRIVDEFLLQTRTYSYGYDDKLALPEPTAPVTASESKALPERLRPQLTGNLMKVETNGEPHIAVMGMYKSYLEATDPKKKETYYHMFRQGLDIQDLDGVLYEVLGTNPNAMGYWLPPLADAVDKQTFFRIPRTRVLKVPLTMLQLTRLDYGTLTETTMQIVDRYCQKVFQLDETKDYFVKTGTFSSKYDFRNAHVTGAKEVRELGEYLLFIQNQAVLAAGPLSRPCIYGMSTTNEWVVREYIHDKENNPCIYKGLPLHTEYRVFVDFDTDTVLGMNPYWDPDVMKKRFGQEEDADSPHQFHDYVIYAAHEETLMKRYQENAGKVKEHVQELLPDVNLTGQWSIDIMQNGEDFWIIDMALAQNSALVECVPKELLKRTEEDWIPKLEG